MTFINANHPNPNTLVYRYCEEKGQLTFINLGLEKNFYINHIFKTAFQEHKQTKKIVFFDCKLINNNNLFKQLEKFKNLKSISFIDSDFNNQNITDPYFKNQDIADLLSFIKTQKIRKLFIKTSLDDSLKRALVTAVALHAFQTLSITTKSKTDDPALVSFQEIQLNRSRVVNKIVAKSKSFIPLEDADVLFSALLEKLSIQEDVYDTITQSTFTESDTTDA